MKDLIATKDTEQTHGQSGKGLLRLLTCGSVDDGKSTLIGRLLHDTHQVYDDQLNALANDSKKQGSSGEKLDLALLVDGLQAEREQGITIDVAYRYFASSQRKFIIADTPGHEQYTRNMATGASHCELAIILIDARKGVLTQTRRHSYIASSLGIKRFVVAINKMDLVDYSQPTFEAIKQHYLEFSAQLNQADLSIEFIPIAAIDGDNVVNKSTAMDWYQGQPLLSILEQSNVKSEQNQKPMRFPVQYVNRPDLNFRGYCGTLISGSVQVGEQVIALPSGKQSKVKNIVTFDGNLTQAQAGQAITITLEDEIDISRGDILVKPEQQPHQSNQLSAKIVWMHESPLSCDKEYEFKFSNSAVNGRFCHLEFKTDVNTLRQTPCDRLELNEIGQCRIQLNQSVSFDLYQDLPSTGSFIVIDKLSNATIAAGMISGEWLSSSKPKAQYSNFELELNTLVRKHFAHWQCLDISESN